MGIRNSIHQLLGCQIVIWHQFMAKLNTAAAVKTKINMIKHRYCWTKKIEVLFTIWATVLYRSYKLEFVHGYKLEPKARGSMSNTTRTDANIVKYVWYEWM